MPDYSEGGNCVEGTVHTKKAPGMCVCPSRVVIEICQSLGKVLLIC